MFQNETNLEFTTRYSLCHKNGSCGVQCTLEEEHYLSTQIKLVS